MLPLLLDILAAACLLIGGVVMALAALGVARLPDLFMRMHAATKAGVVGTGLILTGAGLASDSLIGFGLSSASVLFLLATTPIASHAIGRAAYVSGTPFAETLTADALNSLRRRRQVDRDLAPDPSGHASATTRKEENAMPPALIKRQMQPHAFTEEKALRQVTIWLAGGPSNREAVQFALGLTGASDAKLTGFSSVDPADDIPAAAVPVGGTHWNAWLARSRRARMREAAAEALSEFHFLADGQRDGIATRHEEGCLPDVLVATAGSDLLIVPARVDPYGAETSGEGELAHVLAGRRLSPLIRVASTPDAVLRIAVIVADATACARLAQGLLATGLWPKAGVTVIPLTNDPALLALAREQVEQLQAHDRAAKLGDPVGEDPAPATLRNRFSSYDAAVMSTLSRGKDGLLGVLRDDPVERIAARVPLVLLP